MAPENSSAMARLGGAADMFAALRAAADKIKQGHFKGPIGSEPMVAHAELLTDRLDLAQMGFQPFDVLFAGHVRIDVEVPSRFHVVEKICLVEAEGKLRRVKNVEDDYFVAACAKSCQVFFQRANGRQQIGDKDHYPSLANDLNDPFQRRAKVGLCSTGRLVQAEHQMAQMAFPMPGWQIVPDLFVEGEQTH